MRNEDGFGHRHVKGAAAIAGMIGQLLSPAERETVPFEAGRKGAMAATKYRATRDASFFFCLNLKFDPSRAAMRAHVQAMAGTGATRNGVRVDNGVPIPVRLIIKRIDGDPTTLVLDKTVQEEELMGHSEDFCSKIISVVALKKGDYRVEIEALNDVPEIDGIPVDLDICIPGNRK